MSKRASEESPSTESLIALQRKKHRGKLFSFAKSQTVELVVGPDEEAFNIHRDLLTYHSPYFAARFAERWSSDKTTQIKLPDVVPELFKYICPWLYTSELCIDSGAVGKGGDLGWGDWLELYYQADMLLLADLQNRMVDFDLLEEGRPEWTHGHIDNWHKYGLTETPYYRLFLDECITNMAEEQEHDLELFEESVLAIKSYPEAMADLLLNMYRYKAQNWQKVTEGDRCRYHIHKAGESCVTDSGKSSNDDGNEE